MPNVRRRDVLAGAALLAGSTFVAKAGTVEGQLPWSPNAGAPPHAIDSQWKFFTAEEAAIVEALADRIIPADPKTPGGKEAGCAIFVDGQLAGPYGKAAGLYMSGPFKEGEKSQGQQSDKTPADQYRQGLKALDAYCRNRFSGRGFAKLSGDEQDSVLTDLESGAATLEGADGAKFCDVIIKDVQMGFFADPVYGGNRDMVGWKMIGYPGARYDYRDWVSRHNEPYPHPPVSLMGRPQWTRKG